MNKELRERIENMYTLADLMQEKINWDKDITLKDVLKTELMCFGLYIAASDGTLNYSEARELSSYFDFNLSPQKMNEIIKDQNIYSTEFEEKVPISIQVFVAMDNILYEREQEKYSTEMVSSEMLVEVYAAMAKVMMHIDNDVHEQEEVDWNIYSSTLEKYLDENLAKRKAGIPTGIKKNTGSSVNKEEGVTAPKKNDSVSAPKKG